MRRASSVRIIINIRRMTTSSARARAPNGPARDVAIGRDPDVLAGFLEDAAHFPGGHADGVIAASSEADVAAAVRSARALLPIGAQSSLTGGATPMGETLLTTSRLNRIEAMGDDWVRVQAGVTLAELDAALAAAGKYYPPTPTFMGAFVGGTVATNAAGAATFKYGTTRDWVRALTVVLPDGDVLDIERGTTQASAEFIIVTRDRTLSVPVPRYRRLLRGAGNGSHRSVHRLGRHARHRECGHVACAAGASGAVSGVRAVHRSARRDDVGARCSPCGA